jgi:hypothetical protein
LEALEIARTRPTLSNRAAYRLAGGVIGLGLFASVTPTPLYGTYSVLWHFSPLTLTLIYATYAFGVLATLLLAGGVSDEVTASALVSQLLTGRSAPWLAASTGSIGLAAGTVLIVVAAATNSSPTYLAGSILGGIGFGAAFFGALRALVAKIPAQHRAAVMAAFYVVAYGSLSVPAVLAGVVVIHISLQSTFEIFGSVVAAIGLVVAFEAWRQRPGSHRHSTEPKEAQLEQAS